MTLIVSDAIVLHAFDYLESSRILRLATREGGVQSVLAKGARRTRSRYGAALDLFAEGSAQLHAKPHRELHTLVGFDVTRARPDLAGSLARFAGASAIAELTLRFGSENPHGSLYDAVGASLDAIADASPREARETTLAGAWRIVAELGFAPALDRCGSCHTALASGVPVAFHHAFGGALCEVCSEKFPGGRTVPSRARAAVRNWLAGRQAAPQSDRDGRAHQRLLREFLREHVADARPLRAFDAWEHAEWAAA